MASAAGNVSFPISYDARGRFRKIPVPICRIAEVLADVGASESLLAKVDTEGYQDFSFAELGGARLGTALCS